MAVRSELQIQPGEQRRPARLGLLLAGRLGLAAAWTLTLTIILVQSSAQPLVGPAAPPGQPDLLREVQLTGGHVIAFAGLVLWWWWALILKLPPQRALFVAVGFALIFGTLTEFAQWFVVDRGPSLFDLAVNWSATILMASLISTRWRAYYQRTLPFQNMLNG